MTFRVKNLHFLAIFMALGAIMPVFGTVSSGALTRTISSLFRGAGSNFINSLSKPAGESSLNTANKPLGHGKTFRESRERGNTQNSADSGALLTSDSPSTTVNNVTLSESSTIKELIRKLTKEQQVTIKRPGAPSLVVDTSGAARKWLGQGTRSNGHQAGYFKFHANHADTNSPLNRAFIKPPVAQPMPQPVSSTIPREIREILSGRQARKPSARNMHSSAITPGKTTETALVPHPTFNSKKPVNISPTENIAEGSQRTSHDPRKIFDHHSQRIVDGSLEENFTLHIQGKKWNMNMRREGENIKLYANGRLFETIPFNSRTLVRQPKVPNSTTTTGKGPRGGSSGNPTSTIGQGILSSLAHEGIKQSHHDTTPNDNQTLTDNNSPSDQAPNQQQNFQPQPWGPSPNTDHGAVDPESTKNMPDWLRKMLEDKNQEQQTDTNSTTPDTTTPTGDPEQNSQPATNNNAHTQPMMDQPHALNNPEQPEKLHANQKQPSDNTSHHDKDESAKSSDAPHESGGKSKSGTSSGGHESPSPTPHASSDTSPRSAGPATPPHHDEFNPRPHYEPERSGVSMWSTTPTTPGTATPPAHGEAGDIFLPAPQHSAPAPRKRTSISQATHEIPSEAPVLKQPNFELPVVKLASKQETSTPLRATHESWGALTLKIIIYALHSLLLTLGTFNTRWVGAINRVLRRLGFSVA